MAGDYSVRPPGPPVQARRVWASMGSGDDESMGGPLGGGGLRGPPPPASQAPPPGRGRTSFSQSSPFQGEVAPKGSEGAHLSGTCCEFLDVDFLSRTGTGGGPCSVQAMVARGALLRHRLAMEGGWRYPLWVSSCNGRWSGCPLAASSCNGRWLEVPTLGCRLAMEGEWRCPPRGPTRNSRWLEVPSLRPRGPPSATRTPGPGLLEWQIGRPGPHVVHHRLVVSHGNVGAARAGVVEGPLVSQRNHPTLARLH